MGLLLSVGFGLASACSSTSRCDEFGACAEPLEEDPVVTPGNVDSGTDPGVDPGIDSGTDLGIDAGGDAPPIAQGGIDAGPNEPAGSIGGTMVDAGDPDADVAVMGEGGVGGFGGEVSDPLPQAGSTDVPDVPEEPEVIVECTPEDTRPCSEAGLLGACAAGTQTCSADGLWEDCDVEPADEDSCEPGDDANCNGVPNDSCGCVEGTSRSCAVAGALGNCASGVQVCGADGTFDPCDIEPAEEDSCDVVGDDADCDGTPNGNCPCTSGEERDCGPLTDDGVCEFGTSVCKSGLWGECVGATLPGNRDCTSAQDNDCDGEADNTIDNVCRCAIGTKQTCGEHPGRDGNGPCKAGEATCLAGPENRTSNWSTVCVGSVGPASQDLCNSRGDDSDCDGTPNGGCECIAGDRDDCEAIHDSQGDCASRQLTCRQNGTWPGTSSCAATSSEVCSSNGRDEDCDGQVNEGCECTNGQTRSCGDCDLGSQSCSNGSWSNCTGVDYTVTECGPSCMDCTQPNATASCSSSGQCQNSCLGFQFPAGCASQAGFPACGSWDFETGTEGWSVVSQNNSSSGNRTSPSAWTGSITTTTARSSNNSRSLRVGFNGNGSNDKHIIVLSTQLCPSGQAVTAPNRTLKVDVYIEPTGGYSLPETWEVPNYFLSWNGSNQVKATCDFNPMEGDMPGFFEMSCYNLLDQAATHVGILLRIARDGQQPWQGNLYIDNVRFE